MDTGAIVAFIIVAFSLAAILIMKRDTVPPSLRRGMAIVTLILVAFAFFMIVYSLLQMGK